MRPIDYNDLPTISCPGCNSTQFDIVTTRFDSGRIVACKTCGHIYLNPTLTDDMLAAIYDSYHIAENEQAMMEMITGWFSDPQGQYQYSLNLIKVWGGFSV